MSSQSKPLCVIKLGGSVITDKSKPFEPRLDVMESIALDVSSLLKEWSFVFVLGGGSFGHYAVSEGCTAAQVARFMDELAGIMIDVLLSYGIEAVHVPARAVFTRSKNELVGRCYLQTFSDLLSKGLLPVTHGDVVCSENEGAAVLSGDVIAAYLASKLNARKLLFATNVDAVFHEGKPVTSIKFEDLGKFEVGESESLYDVTGGMKQKLRAIKEYCPPPSKVVIFNGTIPGNLARAIRGELELCTIITR